MKKVSLICLLFAFSYSTLACGSKSSKNSDPILEDFPSSLLTSFLDWTPVLANDIAFPSTGHSGQIVRVFFNETAEPYFKGEKALPFAPGSLVAKAVVDSLETPATDAKKVYFMLKKESGFDSENNDWSYSFALPDDGVLAIDSDSGKNPSCSGCHSAEKEFDYVRTIDFYKKQSAS
jgi:hypothetical protein